MVGTLLYQLNIPSHFPCAPSARAPNGSVTSCHDNGLISSVIGGGEGAAARRMLSWQQQDQLGRTTLLRSCIPGRIRLDEPYFSLFVV